MVGNLSSKSQGKTCDAEWDKVKRAKSGYLIEKGRSIFSKISENTARQSISYQSSFFPSCTTQAKHTTPGSISVLLWYKY
uniref:Uncharacterized protein n=1 Tax=Arundo donax TaxID=35708 RepID=A0A0A9GP49_ARUDO